MSYSDGRGPFNTVAGLTVSGGGTRYTGGGGSGVAGSSGPDYYDGSGFTNYDPGVGTGGSQPRCYHTYPSDDAYQQMLTRHGAAVEMAKAIQTMNWQNVEYGGYVSEGTDGAYRFGPITTLNMPTGWVPSYENELGLSSLAEVRSVLHNHPLHAPQLQGRDAYPSDGDWAGFKDLQRRMRDLGYDPSKVTLIVMANDGNLYEYVEADQQARDKLGFRIDMSLTAC